MLTAAPRTAVDWLMRRKPDPQRRSLAEAEVSALKPAVVVTGASAGIGLAIAKRFLKSGSTVALVARHAERLSAARNALPQDEKDRCIAIVCDVSSEDAPRLIDAALREHNLFLDVLVNNAGLGLSGPFLDHAQSEIDRLVSLNVAALTRLTRHALPAMIARGRGGLINVASLGGYVPGPYQAAYYASKAYVLSLSEAIAWESSGSGVKVCCVAPGPVGTGFHAAMGASGSRYRILLPELSAERVANSAYRAFKLGQHVVVPGLLYRLMFVVLRLTPHPISVPLTGWLLRGPASK